MVKCKDCFHLKIKTGKKGQKLYYCGKGGFILRFSPTEEIVCKGFTPIKK